MWSLSLPITPHWSKELPPLPGRLQWPTHYPSQPLPSLLLQMPDAGLSYSVFSKHKHDHISHLWRAFVGSLRLIGEKPICVYGCMAFIGVASASLSSLIQLALPCSLCAQQLFGASGMLCAPAVPSTWNHFLISLPNPAQPICLK